MAADATAPPVRKPPGPQITWWDMLRDGTNLALRRGAPFTARIAAIAAEYGNVARIRDPRESYLASHPDLVRQVLITDGHLTRRGRSLEFVRLVLGNGLLTAEGEEHMRHRRLVSPAFNKEHVRGYARVMLGAIADHDRHWRERIDDGRPEVEMTEEMSDLTLRVAGLALFGTDLEERGAAIGPALATGQRMLALTRLPGASFLLTGPTPWARKLQESGRTIHVVVDELIAEHRADPDRFDGDVLSTLLAARDDDGKPMSDEQIRDEVTTLLIGGHETTANLLAWTWYLLDRHPAAAARLHAEVDGLGRAPQATDAAPGQLPYTRAVLAESMRLFPPSWTIARRYASPGSIAGYQIPLGTKVLTSQWVIHRDPRWWGKDAATFDPERWLTSGQFDTRAPGQPRYAFFPFGAGRRVCVGEHFALTEALLAVAVLAQHWHPQLDPDQVIEVEPMVTLRPRYGMRMRLHPRHVEHVGVAAGPDAGPAKAP